MEVCYKKLWKILIDKDMKKKDLQFQAGISRTLVKKCQRVRLLVDVLVKVCKTLECNIGDIIDLVLAESSCSDQK